MTKTNASWKRKQVSSFKKTNALITTTECAPPFSVQSLKVVSLLQHPQLRLHEDLGVGSSVLLGWMSDQTMFMVINLCVHKYEWQKPCYKLLYLLLQKSRTPRWGHKVHRGRGNTRALHWDKQASVSESGDIDWAQAQCCPWTCTDTLSPRRAVSTSERISSASSTSSDVMKEGRDGFQWQQPGGAPRHRLSGGAEEVCGRVGLVWSVPGRGPQRDELHPDQ